MKKTSEIKQISLKALAGNWGSAIGASAIVYGITYAASMLASFVSYIAMMIVSIGNVIGNGAAVLENPMANGETVTMGMAAGIGVYNILIYLLSFIGSIITTNIALGFYKYILKLSRRETVGISEVFSPLRKHWWRSFALMFMIELKAILWMFTLYVPGVILLAVGLILKTSMVDIAISAVLVALAVVLMLCSVVPFIIAYYRYVLAPIIFVENPSIGVFGSIRRSKELMRGHKGELFVLHLSFIGWAILTIFTCGIGTIALSPYSTMATVVFYNELLGIPTADYTVKQYSVQIPEGGWGDYNPNPVGKTFGSDGNTQNAAPTPEAPAAAPVQAPVVTPAEPAPVAQESVQSSIFDDSTPVAEESPEKSDENQ